MAFNPEAAQAFTFDDFQLVPQHSTVRSRKDPVVRTEAGSITLETPLIASPMNTVTGTEMARAMADAGGTAVLHRYQSIEAQVAQAVELREHGTLDLDTVDDFWAAVGVSGDAVERVEALWAVGVRRFCVDVANGHSQWAIGATAAIKTAHPDALVMAGNVCSYDGALALAEVGADALRVGIGPGSMCTTRLVTGHGIPQLTAIDECSRVKQLHPDTFIIADGGIRSSGDCVKALAAGADAVMLGSLLAGTSETPGDIITDADGSQWKHYAGMASEAGRGRDAWFSRDRTAFVPEGSSTRVRYKGETHFVLQRTVGGIRVGMSYAGAHSLRELQDRAEWRRVTPSGIVEATPHGV